MPIQALHKQTVFAPLPAIARVSMSHLLSSLSEYHMLDDYTPETSAKIRFLFGILSAVRASVNYIEYAFK